MAASIGSGLLVVILVLFVNPLSAAIAFLILVPSCAFMLLRSNRARVAESREVGRKQFWYKTAGFALIAGAIVHLVVHKAQASHSGTSVEVGPLAEFAVELGLAVFLLMPIQKAR